MGTFTFPHGFGWLLDAMAVVASETFTSTSAPIQYAAVRAFEGGVEIEQYLHQARRILHRLGRYACERLTDAGAVVPTPKGAFYVFPDLSPLRESLAQRGIKTSRQLCETLLEQTGVAVLPGSAFGRPRDELSFRAAYVDFDGARALVAAQHVDGQSALSETFLRDNCHNVVEAIDRIAAWLKKP